MTGPFLYEKASSFLGHFYMSCIDLFIYYFLFKFFVFDILSFYRDMYMEIPH